MHIEIRAGAPVKIQFPNGWTQTGNSGSFLLVVNEENEVDLAGLGTGTYSLEFDIGHDETLIVQVVAS